MFSGPGSISFISNVIVIAGVLMAPIAIFSFFSRLKNEMKRDAGERFETAAQLQNSINSMMVAFVTALMRQGVQQGPRSGEIRRSSEYEDWNLYEANDYRHLQLPPGTSPMLGNYRHLQLPPGTSPMLGNSYSHVKKKGGTGFLVGLLTGFSVFLLLTLITIVVLTVKM